MNLDERFGDLLVGLSSKEIHRVGEAMASTYHEGDTITRDKVALFVRYVKGEITGEEYVTLGMEKALAPKRELVNA